MRTLGFSASLILGCFSLQAGPALDGALDSLSSVHQFHDAVLSLDRATVAWTETIPGKDGRPRESFVYVKDLPIGAPHRIGAAGESDHVLAWSRDGRLAFLSTSDSGEQLQLYVADKSGRGKPRKVTDLKGYINDPHWSPDGRTIAVLWIEHIVHVLMQVVTRLVCMDAGRIIAEGAPEAVVAHAAVVDAYLGSRA